MAAITMKLDTKNLVGGLDRLQARFPAAIARALNRSIVSARVVMASAVATDMGLKVSDVKERIGLIEASAPDRLVATLTASGKRLPLIDFNARGPEPSRGKGGGVRARMPGGAGTYPHAFIATMRSGHRGVYERVGPSSRRSVGARSNNLPIVELRGPSIRASSRSTSRSAWRAAGNHS
jgi:hypothetical protein